MDFNKQMNLLATGSLALWSAKFVVSANTLKGTMGLKLRLAKLLFANLGKHLCCHQKT